MDQKIIETVGYIYIQNKKLLLTRNKRKKAFYLPGGKIENREDKRKALIRELKEELAINLITSSIQYIGCIHAQAYGEPPGTLLRMYCYTADFDGTIVASTEIEEMSYFSSAEYFQNPDTAPAAVPLFKLLREKGWVD